MRFTPIVPIELDGTFNKQLLEKAALFFKERKSLEALPNKNISFFIGILNAYHSNLIEKEAIEASYIENTIKGILSDDSEIKSLQELFNAHIEAELQLMKNKDSPFSLNFMLEAHKLIFSFFRNKKSIIKPGKLRDLNVEVGFHVPVDHFSLRTSLEEFEDAYKKVTKHENKEFELLSILSSHHRFLWIHPFLDGNGRVSRMLLHLLLGKSSLEVCSSWSSSRALAKNEERYKNLLSAADQIKTNDYDGRGNLSKKALYDFVSFLLDIFIEEIRYMQRVLRKDVFKEEHLDIKKIRREVPDIFFKD